jgi:hypothetical protein
VLGRISKFDSTPSATLREDRGGIRGRWLFLSWPVGVGMAWGPGVETWNGVPVGERVLIGLVVTAEVSGVTRSDKRLFLLALLRFLGDGEGGGERDISSGGGGIDSGGGGSGLGFAGPFVSAIRAASVDLADMSLAAAEVVQTLLLSGGFKTSSVSCLGTGNMIQGGVLPTKQVSSANDFWFIGCQCVDSRSRVSSLRVSTFEEGTSSVCLPRVPVV